MKKNLLFFLLFATILLAGCFNSNQFKEIDSNTWKSDEGFSVEQVFNNQIEKAQYFKDLEEYISYNILSSTENKPFNSDFSLDVKFDENSSVQGGLKVYQNKNSKSYNLESRDIEFNIEARKVEEDLQPFDASGSVTLLYQDNEMYANLHNFGVFMGEGNMVGKMYTLLGDMILDKRVNLEVNSGGIISVNTEEDVKLQYLIGTIINVLKTEEIYNSPNFINSVVELIERVNSYIDLGISTNGLSVTSVGDIKYAENSDGSIQKEFTANFQGLESSFNLSFVASPKGLDFHLYNIGEFDTDLQSYRDLDSEFILSIKEIEKSEYDITFQSIKAKQKIVDMEGNIDFDSTVKFEANFVLEPLQLISGQKISGKLEGYIIKQSAKGDEVLPELSGDVILFSDLMSSL